VFATCVQNDQNEAANSPASDPQSSGVTQQNVLELGMYPVFVLFLSSKIYLANYLGPRGTKSQLAPFKTTQQRDS
jgi:hypothetical protein